MPEIDYKIDNKPYQSKNWLVTIIILILSAFTLISVLIFNYNNLKSPPTKVSISDTQNEKIRKLENDISQIQNLLSKNQKVQQMINLEFQKSVENLLLSQHVHDKKTESVDCISGKLQVRSNVNNDTLWVDNKNIGSTSSKIHILCIGKHNIEVKKQGYKAYRESINIYTGKTKTLMAILHRD